MLGFNGPCEAVQKVGDITGGRSGAVVARHFVSLCVLPEQPDNRTSPWRGHVLRSPEGFKAIERPAANRKRLRPEPIEPIAGVMSNHQTTLTVATTVCPIREFRPDFLPRRGALPAGWRAEDLC